MESWFSKKQSFMKALVLSLAFIIFLSFPAFPSPRLAEKRSQLQEVKAELEAIDSRLSQAVEDHDYARYRLGKIQRRIQRASRILGANKKRLAERERVWQKRVRAVYIQGPLSELNFMFEVNTFEQFLEAGRYAQLITKSDAQIVKEIRRLKAQNERELSNLNRAKKAQLAVLRKIAQKKAYIKKQLAARQKLYNSIKADIKRIEAAEAARQAALRRRYLARLSQLRAVAQVVNRTNYTYRGEGRSSLVSIALAQLGKPYSWGAAGPNAFDCSGLVVYCYSQLGISVPHSSRALYGMGTPVSLAELQPGDLVFFARGGRIHHVGIYIGGGNFIHSPHSGDVVKIAPLSSHSGYAGARRI
jgi:cell wall-associated NlpC family hydrolase